MIWLAFAILTAATALGLVWPLARRQGGVAVKGAEIDFYTGQLADVAGDVERGAIRPEEAAVTRAEIARRLLAAARTTDPATRPPARGPRLLAVAMAVAAMPAATIALYLALGHPSEPDLPLAARSTGAEFALAAALPKIEAHLAAHPEDGRGFALVAPIYMRLGRYDDAAHAYASALAVMGEDAERRAALGQALVMAADGVVTADARAAFDKAIEDDPRMPEARFFQAMAAEQDGDRLHALALWQALAADTPADAPWRTNVDQHVAALSNPAAAAPAPPAPLAARPRPQGGPDSAAGAAIAALPADQQQQVIHGMVDGLAARLAQNGRDCDGWLRLIRAYTVLGEQDKARAAIGSAHRGLAGDVASEARIDELGHELGLGG